MKLSDRFIKYLNQDGIFQPENENLEQDNESDGNNSDNDDDLQKQSQEIQKESEEERQIFLEEVKLLRSWIDQTLDEWGNGVFVKLNWSSGKDAEWINPTFQCISSDEVFTTLKSSQFIAHDYTCPFHESIPDFKPEQYYLILRRWHNLNLAMEFRCFLKEGKLIGVSQRDTSAYYEYLTKPDFNNLIWNKIDAFVNEKFNVAWSKYQSDLRNIVLDIYIDAAPKYKVWIIDINPWIVESVDPLLFKWEELEDFSLNDCTQKQQSSLQWVRVIENKNSIRPSDTNQFKVPTDLESMEEFMRNVNNHQFS
ncbi:UNKNOWN [Stylonychia lemnae]|uniref:Cell division cycle protein 123 homolog n=1 Tax=Stylonychia lemnae TaxID=5949 RepID=A0A077ZZA0_STYLE|nr:UNKNOWN [Stylonychia lemnae]|eukprot:CDW74912.1 UNKNOWN [Stylonychia lemnae]